ncbi:hypothetical protein LZ30DRAFT_734185, partial [Colletotrichum cereale]
MPSQRRSSSTIWSRADGLPLGNERGRGRMESFLVMDVRRRTCCQRGDEGGRISVV